MTMIDLGGGPAWEDCAQLGRTLDFDALNRLELACHEAALRARHGPAPDGCADRRRDNRHDSGTYRTLALDVDECVTREAHRYAEPVGRGLDRWLEAGFRAPVEYAGGAAVRIRSFDTVILGALQVTRPEADGRFSFDDFATLHANLAAAHPALAAPFDQHLQGEAG